MDVSGACIYTCLVSASAIGLVFYVKKYGLAEKAKSKDFGTIYILNILKATF
jgi:hypothetical protein